MKAELKKRIADINNGIVPEGYKKTKTGVFPVDWREIKIGDLFYKVSERNNGQFDKTKWISVAKMYYQEPEKVTSNNIDTRTYVMRLGDMAFEGHQNKDYLFGRFVVNDIGDGIISELFPIYRHKGVSVSEYWKYAIQYEDIMAHVYSRCITISGASSNKINDEEFVKEKLCVPSIDEQRKIASILTTQDKLITLQEQKVDSLKKLKKAYLEKMFPKKGSKYPEYRFKGFTDAWEQRKLNDIADVRDGTHASPQYLPTGHPFITSKNVKDGYINYDDVQYISNDDFEEINKRSKVDVNDILMGMIGTIGNLALIRNIPDFAIKNVALIKDTGAVFYLYLYYCLQSETVINQLSDNMDGGTQKFVALKGIRGLNITFPSRSEQEVIGSFFSNLDSLITLHQRKLEAEKKKKKALMQLLLTGKVRV